jgi:hypothetical protein
MSIGQIVDELKYIGFDTDVIVNLVGATVRARRYAQRYYNPANRYSCNYRIVLRANGTARAESNRGRTHGGIIVAYVNG